MKTEKQGEKTEQQHKHGEINRIHELWRREN